MTATANRPTAWVRLQQVRRADELKSGAVRVPIACGHCYSRNIDTQDDGRYLCQSCGRKTDKPTAHRIRSQRMRAYIERGVR